MQRLLSLSTQLLVFASLVVGNTGLLAQSPSGTVCDTIVTRDNEILEVKLVDIGARDISYRACDYLDGPLRHIKKRKVQYTSSALGKREHYPALQGQWGVSLSLTGSHIQFAGRPELALSPGIPEEIDTLKLWKPSFGLWYRVFLDKDKSSSIRMQALVGQRGYREILHSSVYTFDLNGNVQEALRYQDGRTYQLPVIAHSYEFHRTLASWCSLGAGVQFQHFLDGQACREVEVVEVLEPLPEGTQFLEVSECAEWQGFERRFDVVPFLKGQIEVGPIGVFCQLEWGTRARYRETYQLTFTDDVGNVIRDVVWEDYAFGRAISLGLNCPLSQPRN